MLALRILLVFSSSFSYYNQYVRYLSWYHNGTLVSSSGRVNTIDNGTLLIINNMVESDAGTYQVRIGSLGLINYEPSTSDCDENFLRVLENYALYAPVTFHVHQNTLLTYDFEQVINKHYLPSYVMSTHKHYYTNNVIDINASLILNRQPLPSRLFKDGILMSFPSVMYNYTVSYGSTINQTHILTYNNSNDVIGYYVQIEYSWSDDFSSNCQNYQNYIFSTFHWFFPVPVSVLFWSIKIYSK